MNGLYHCYQLPVHEIVCANVDMKEEEGWMRKREERVRGGMREGMREELRRRVGGEGEREG